MIKAEQIIEAGLNTDTPTGENMLSIATARANDDCWINGVSDNEKIIRTVSFLNESLYYNPKIKDEEQ